MWLTVTGAKADYRQKTRQLTMETAVNVGVMDFKQELTQNYQNMRGRNNEERNGIPVITRQDEVNWHSAVRYVGQVLPSRTLTSLEVGSTSVKILFWAMSMESTKLS